VTVTEVMEGERGLHGVDAALAVLRRVDGPPW
jgi:hypothetical protein